MKSMTGHGRGESLQHGYKVAVEISAVNRKQLEIQVNLPREFDRHEGVVRERVQAKVSRGRVSVRISVLTAKGEEVSRVVINRELAEESARQLRAIAESVQVEAAISIEAVMRVPGVIRIESGVEDADMVLPAIRKATDQAIKALLEMRVAEGEQLAKDLKHRIELMSKAVSRVERRAPKVLTRYREQLMERIKQAKVDVSDPNDERLLKEVVLFADRSDITEELTRLESHFQQFKRLVVSKQPVGRTLDFLAQELNREVNTVGSKANDAAISKDVVVLKTELEKFREQVQNVE
ncbi:YicC family protein [bacterium]|jgi:uncharacterized protein (TIGR00255 family)|nr:YicC family protein [Verrucomicrobiota bacterium]MDA7644767.1 YicC family protein [bacterium]